MWRSSHPVDYGVFVDRTISRTEALGACLLLSRVMMEFPENGAGGLYVPYIWAALSVLSIH